MSRQNKVNPGMYTQRGRLTQDDAARELRKQSAIRSPHTWQPVNTNTKRRLAPGRDGRDTGDAERSADNETMVKASPRVAARPASRVTKTKASPSNAKTKAAKATTATPRTAKRTTRTAKTGKAKATAMKRTTTTRKAARR